MPESPVDGAHCTSHWFFTEMVSIEYLSWMGGLASSSAKWSLKTPLCLNFTVEGETCASHPVFHREFSSEQTPSW